MESEPAEWLARFAKPTVPRMRDGVQDLRSPPFSTNKYHLKTKEDMS